MVKVRFHIRLTLNYQPKLNDFSSANLLKSFQISCLVMLNISRTFSEFPFVNKKLKSRRTPVQHASGLYIWWSWISPLGIFPFLFLLMSWASNCSFLPSRRFLRKKEKRWQKATEESRRRIKPTLLCKTCKYKERQIQGPRRKSIPLRATESIETCANFLPARLAPAN